MSRLPAQPPASARASAVRAADELAALHETAKGLLDRLDLDGVLESILERAARLVGTPDAYLYLVDGDELVVRFGLGQFSDQVGYRLAIGDGLAGRVYQSGAAMVIDDYQVWSGRRRDLEGRPFRAVAGVPLRAGNEVVGVIGLAYAEPGRRFGREEIELLTRFADFAALALENARLYTEAREGATRFRSLVGNIPGAIYQAEFDERWSIGFMSDAVEPLSGYPAEDFTSGRRTITSLIHPDERTAVLEEFERVARSGEPYVLEYRIVHRDGSLRWVNERSRGVPSPDGRILLDGSLFDATERKAAEEKLRAAEARYRSLVETLPLVTYARSLRFGDGNLYVSPQVEDILGTPVDEWMKADLLGEVVHPEDRERVLAAAAHLRETGEPFREEYRVMRPDGSVIWVHDETRIVRDAAGQPEYVQGFLLDITELHEAEETRSRLAAIVESSGDAIFSTALDGSITTWNAGAERMYGYRSEEIVGQPVSTLMPPERRAEMRTILDRVKRGESVFEFETVRVRKDGSPIDVALTVSPIVDAAGNVIGASGIQRDITERQRAAAERERLLTAEREARAAAEAAQRVLAAQNEQLRELDRLKDEFIALVSHELRTPLTSIRGYIELILEDEMLSPRQRKYLEVADRNSDRLLRLVGDLLFLAQLEAGTLELEPGWVDLAAIAAESAAAAAPAAETKSIAVTLETDEVPPLAGDPARIAQVVDNLVSNAIKFTPDEGSVTVRVVRDGDEAVLEVRDTGIGIPAEELPHLFERFFRTTQATARAIQGTGLGLAISRRLVEAHAGRITVQSREGAGTVFRVALPLVGAADLRPLDSVAV